VDEATLTVGDVAKRLKLSTDSVLSLIRSGRLRASNVGLGKQRPRWRIAPEAIDQFLAERAAPKRAPRRRRRDRGSVIEFF
jgi:excisionase family DNA binding protein